MLERYLIEHCSPTLASLKTASLFTMAFSEEAELERQLEAWNLEFADKGILLLALKKSDGKALIYLCRKKRLQQDLQKPGVAELLAQYGYENVDADAAVKQLQQRLQQSEGFPHEIGIFLGYPLGDVIGFIRNAGHNCKCVGCWKVYCNECEAIKTFARYQKCKDVYLRLWKEGRSIRKLTVAA